MKLFSRIYTTAMLCAATAIILPAQTYTTLFSFGGTNGLSPAALVQSTDGYLYGTTFGGGINGSTGPCASIDGCGTVFKITPNGTLTTLYSFCGFSQCPDGAVPNAPLVQAVNGDFYGTTSGGGSSSYCTSAYYYYAPGCGTVFKMTASGLLTTIYNFCSQVACADGAVPMAGLVRGSDGVLYGTTTSGGANNAGSIFKITLDGNLTTLYSFCSLSGCADGEVPAGLVQATNGDLYGTTSQGGSSTYCASVNPFASTCGTVFRITPSGTFTTLYSFCAQSGCADGFFPNGGLVQATNGRLYGTTAEGGITGTIACFFSGCGTVFKITSSGALTTVYSFTGEDDGEQPESGLIQATDGNLYGTTDQVLFLSPDYFWPTIFKVTPAGSLTTLVAFPAGTVGPSALVQDTNGYFYATTDSGGTAGAGTIYRLSVGLGPFVKLQPASGEESDPVDILGNNLTGATAVSFNGTPASFKVISNALIQANVPSGATTGKVRVRIPGGTLVSDVSFQVRP